MTDNAPKQFYRDFGHRAADQWAIWQELRAEHGTDWFLCDRPEHMGTLIASGWIEWRGKAVGTGERAAPRKYRMVDQRGARLIPQVGTRQRSKDWHSKYGRRSIAALGTF